MFLKLFLIAYITSSLFASFVFILRHGYIDVNLFVVFFIFSLVIAIISKLLRINEPGVIALSMWSAFFWLQPWLGLASLLCGKDEISALKDLFLSVTALLGALIIFLLPVSFQIIPITPLAYFIPGTALIINMPTDFGYLGLAALVLFWSIKRRAYMPFGIAFLLAIFLPFCKAPFLLLAAIALDVYRLYERRKSQSLQQHK